MANSVPKHISSNQLFLTMRVIHFALIASLLIYCFVIHMITGGDNPSIVNLDINPLIYAFSSSAVFIFLISRYVKKQLLLISSNPLLNTEQQPQSKPIASLFKKSILIWALDDAIGVFGLILSFLSGDPRYCYGFIALALVILLLDRPRRSWIQRADQFTTETLRDTEAP
jgi:F0F1-type ATP synthase membrane subunit c/vacuolar-type H+-ATPase subunit K